MRTRDCTQCGKCCEKYGGGAGLGSISIEEVERFNNDRNIMQYVSDIGFGIHDIWINPITGDDVMRCPFLKENKGKYSCTIYDVRPDVCREYPIDIDQMKRDGCEMICG